MRYSASSYLELPTKPGVYRFLDDHDKVLYVGKAKDLKARVSSYFTNRGLLEEKTRALVSQIQQIEITIVESELESLLLEAFYIKKFTPKYNIRLVDNKTYPVIKITMNDTFPAVLMSRRVDDPKALYFGPYPSSTAVKLVLRTIRRAFPFMSVTNHPKRHCLYYHLKLCPCLPVENSPENRRAYSRNLKQIVRILEGESQKILKEMEKEREKLSKEEKFEEALTLQQKIRALGYITQPFHRPFEYDVNPNLREDIRARELEELRQILNHNGYNIPFISKIECYDISHIQGTNTVASMVVFVNGEKESSLYRKYKIKHEKTPDDFASMREVLKRRFKHTEWEYPELIIVDGGKGQVSAAMDVLEELGIEIPLIGLAKREETIVIPMSHPAVDSGQASSDSIGARMTNKNDFSLSEVSYDETQSKGSYKKDDDSNFKEVLIPQEVKAIQLIMRIRDEAHRFAITFHRKLRSKSALESLGISK